MCNQLAYFLIFSIYINILSYAYKIPISQLVTK